MSKNFTTYASNFTSALETKVDPRTGQFIVNLGVISLCANNKLGPNFNLFLNYSPLNSILDYGFGKHFSLGGISHFNTSTNTLELSSGKKYKVTPGTVSIINKKLNTFLFSYINKDNPEEGYNILWKDGKKETLEPVGDGTTYIVKKILSPLGREINLTWFWSGQVPKLSEIRDEFTILCKIEYSFITKVTIWPNSKDEYSLNFKFINYDQLDTIYWEVKNKRKLYWFFSYDAVNSYSNLLSQIIYPSEMKESVSYNQEIGLNFPNSSLEEKLPIVIRHELDSGDGQPKTITDYKYTTYNFLGYEGNFGIWDSNSDYIYNTLTDYTYGSTAIVTGQEATTETTRLYNNYHLQISEEIRTEDSIHLSEIEYYAKLSTFIDGQPDQFQLPKEKKETWKCNTKKTSRTQKTESTFDKNGNPLLETSPDGTITEISWYDPLGETGSPKELNGFTRFIKEKKIIHPSSEYPTPIATTKYTYKNLGETDFIVRESEENYSDDILLSRKVNNYYSDKDQEFGRLVSVENTIFDFLDSGKSYTSKTYFENTFPEEKYSQKVKSIGFDNLEISFSKTYSPYSNLLLSEINDKELTTSYTYDDLGRILSSTLNQGTEYESTKTWEYENINKILRITESDSQGNFIRTSYNGAGVEILKEVLDSNSSTQKWYVISEQKYNSIKEVISTESTDWIPSLDTNDLENKITLKEKYEYDNWGNLSTLISKNNLKYIYHVDPINLTKYQTKEINNLKSSSSITQFDINGKPLSQTLKDSEGEEISKKVIKYNRAGDIVEEIDEIGNSTKYEYERDGRLKTQILPDGTEIKRTYAQFLNQDFVTSISVKGMNSQGEIQTWVLGTQEFDSLGRVTKVSNGGRTTRYRYKGNSSNPSLIMTPSEDMIQYSYIKELDDSISEVRSRNILQSFEYDPVSSFPLKARENNGSELENIWDKSGSLKSVTSLMDNQEKKTSSYTNTLLKQTLTYTDFCGKTSKYIRNDLGFITQVIDEEVIFD